MRASGRWRSTAPRCPTISSRRFAVTRVALKGPVTTPVGEGFTSVNVGLRKALDLYANLRPVSNLPHVRSRFDNVDLVIVRENTEDLYSGLEHEVVPGVVESLKIITERASTRIARFAFEYATRMGRKRVTGIHKANIMKMGDGLFIRCARAVAAEHPDIRYDEQIVDAACMNLVMKPETFDVLLLPNLYGDIVSDLCAGLVGGLGTVGAANLGESIGVFEAVHGSAPDIAGKNLANPTALLLSALMMLRHIGEFEAAARIESALLRVLATPEQTHTRPRWEGDNRRVRACYSSQHSMVPDDLAQAVLAREDVARYLRSSHGGSDGRDRVFRVPRRAENDTALSVLPGAEAPALSDPAQDRSPGRARRPRRGRHAQGARHLRVQPQEPHRLSGGTARARRQRRAAADHRSRHQPLRRSARPHPQACDRRDPDPPQHEGSGVPGHPQGLRRGTAAAPRPALLSRGRTKLQRRDQAAKDRPPARRAAVRAAGTHDRPHRHRRTTWCSRITCWRASG